MDASKNSRDQRKNRKSKKPFLDDLIDELLTEILIRIPLDSIHRCKIISKRWLSLISSAEFARRYVLHKPINCQRSLFYHYSHNPYCDPFGAIDVIESPSILKPFSFNFVPINPESVGSFDETVRLAGYCNGLLLCSATPSRISRTIYYICNPLTKQWVLLPTPPPLILSTIDVSERAAFICDNIESHDPRYKVVLFPQHGYTFMSSVNIFSFCSESGNWSEFYVKLPRGLRWSQHFSDIVAYNRKLYGLFLDGIFVYDPYNKPSELSLIDLPQGIQNEYILNTCLGVIQGKIRVCYLETQTTNISLHMWELDSNGASTWNKLQHKVSVNDMVSDLSLFNIRLKEANDHISARCFNEIDGDIVYFFDYTSIFLCNLKTKMLEVLFYIPSYKGVIHNVLPPILLPSWPTPLPRIKIEPFVDDAPLSRIKTETQLNLIEPFVDDEIASCVIV